MPPPPPGIAPLLPSREPAPRPPALDPLSASNGFGYDPLTPVTAPPVPTSPAQPYHDPMIDTGGLAKIMAGLTAPSLDPDTPPPGSRSTWPLTGDPSGDLAFGTDSLATSSFDSYKDPFASDPYNDPFGDGFGKDTFGKDAFSNDTSLDLPRQRDSRVAPPWQSDDLPVEPPGLRLVEPAPLTDPALSEDRGFVDELSGEFRFEPPALRLVDSDRDRAGGNSRLPMRQRAERPIETSASDQGDGDLLIFAAARSAWFTDHIDSEDDAAWSNANDAGWRAAQQAAEPLVGAETTSGLPRRVPQQNLVPGSPAINPDRPLHIVRDAAAIAAHTTGYFRGWRRGQEAGGYRVGGRPGREPSAGWDFSRDTARDRDYAAERQYEFEYRSAHR